MSNSSPLQKDILKGREIARNGIIVDIGNGKDTSHHWVGDKPIYLMPNITILDSKAHFRVFTSSALFKEICFRGALRA